jgi:hypothetical protein
MPIPLGQKYRGLPFLDNLLEILREHIDKKVKLYRPVMGHHIQHLINSIHEFVRIVLILRGRVSVHVFMIHAFRHDDLSKDIVVNYEL